MKITRQQLLDLWMCITELANTTWGKKFNIQLVELKMVIKPAVTKILEREGERFPTKYKTEYEPRRIELCIAHAKMDVTGTAMQHNGSYVIEDRDKFDKALAALESKYAEEIKAYEKATGEWQDYAQGEADELEAELPLIMKAELPDQLSPRHIELLWPALKHAEKPAESDSVSAE